MDPVDFEVWHEGDPVTCATCGYEVPLDEVDRDWFYRCRACVMAGHMPRRIIVETHCAGCARQLPDSGRVQHACATCRPKLVRKTALGQEVYILPEQPQWLKIDVRIET